MDFDEIVETSDVEELEEIQKSRNHCVRGSLERLTPPPRKKTKYFHAPETHEGPSTSSPARDESTRINSPQRSQSSSTMFTANTSPGPLFTSRSPTQSPGQAFDVYSLPKTEEEDMPMEFYSAHSEDSQDPLLLHSPTRHSPTTSRISSPLASPFTTTPLSIPQSTTPTNSPPRYRHESQSPPLRFPDSPLPTHSQEVHSEPTVDENTENDLLLFTPTKAASPRSHSISRSSSIDPFRHLFSSRDTSPERERSPSLSPTSENARNLRPSDPPEPRNSRSFSLTSEDGENLAPGGTPIPTVSHPQEDASVTLANQLNALNEGRRYSLRERTVTQKMPFTTEDIRYKRQLKGIPEAIVKNKALERHHHHHHHPDDHYEEDGETQQDFVVDSTNPEDDAWEHMDRPRKRRRLDEQQTESTEPDVTHYPGILQGLPETDEEEEKEMDAVTREARRLIKQKAKEKKAKEKEEREQKAREEKLKAKRFPVPKRLQSPRRKSSVEPNDINNGGDRKDEGDASQPSDHNHGGRQPSIVHSTSVSAAMEDYFAQNDDFDLIMDHLGNQSNHEVQDNYFEWDQNPPINENNPASPNIETNPGVPVPVEVDGDEAFGVEQDEGTNRSQSAEIDLDLEPSKERVLKKMYPRFMLRSMIDGADALKKSKPRRPQEKEKDSDDEGILRAGHTRKQISANPKDIRDIKGDSESELELSNSGSDSSTDSSSDDDVGYGSERKSSIPSSSGAQNTPTGHQRQIVKTDKREVIDLTNQYSDAEETGPSNWYKHRGKGNGGERLRNTSMIDYMLAKSSRLEPKRSKRTRSSGRSSGKQSKFKHDITIGPGHGREIQTTLDFRSNGASFHRRRSSKKRKVTSGYNLDDQSDEGDEDETPDVRLSDFPNDSAQQRKLDKKKKYREKKKKEKYIGVHVFSGGAQKIVSGRRQLRVDVGNSEEFQKFLVPSSQTSNQIDWSREYAPPLVQKRPKRRDTPGNTSNHQEAADESSTKAPLSISSHFNLPILQPGKSFAPSTYIKKGWLYQLTTLDANVPQPFFSVSTILGFEIGPDMGVEQLCILLPNVFEGLLDYATGLPDPDSELTRAQWLLLMRGISQLTSWYLKSSGTEEASNLRHTVQKEVLQIVEQIEQASISFVDIPALTACWFMVDMSARIQLNPQTSEGLDIPLKYSSSLLMRLLLQLGIDKTMQVLLDDADLDGTSSASYSLELWVCLIHVLSNAKNGNADARPQKHPFWQLLKDMLTARVTALNTRTPLESSEDVWFTILSVCTMSQFSVHGMVLSQFHLPADWSIVSFAFKRLHLGKVPQPNEHVRSLDIYVSLIVDRCYDLHERYKWNLDDPNTYAAFNELAEIFRVRKFANLLHEKSEYSRFFQKADWDLLPSRMRKDSAFSVFLKLVVQAALSDKLHAAGKPSPRVKKLLSIVIPMASLPFTEANKPQGNDLTKFYNRITALVVAGDLDRGSIGDRIQKARGYINFLEADHKSRIAVIRAIRNWGIMLVDRKMSLRAFSPWIEELANVLYGELKKLSEVEPDKGREQQRVPRWLVDMIACLLSSVRNLSNACAKHKRYPYLYFLDTLRPLLVQGTLDFSYPGFEEEYLLLIESIFLARSAALPPPPRPALQALPTHDEESQESQDFGIQDDFANMDWSGLDLPGLAAPAPAPPKIERDDDNEDSFRASIKKFTAIKWAVFRALIRYFPGSKGYEMGTLEVCSRWLHCYFGFAAVDGQDSTWTFYLGKVDEELRKCAAEHWIRDVELCIMLTVLKYAPMQYLPYTERAFGSLLNALVSVNNIASEERETDNMFEREYVSWVLSIDGLRHPLLSDMTIDIPAPNQTSGDYEFGLAEFLPLRIPLLRAIFKNLERHITLQLRETPEVPFDTDKYITLCSNMFSGMRNNLSRLDKSSARFTEYHAFTNQAVEALQGNRELCERMKFWANWHP